MARRGAPHRHRRPARSGTSGCAAGGVALLDTGTILDTDAHPALVQVTGTASDLLLALYGRVGLDSLGVQGDRHLIDGLRVG